MHFIMIVEELGDLSLLEFELESPVGETWYLDYVVVCDIHRGFTWYFPYHNTFNTGVRGIDRNVLMRDRAGGNK